MPTVDEINQHLHEQIPMTSQMGILVKSFSTDEVLATAPLAANINHQQSAFGGSIAALGIVTGFVAIWGNLKLRKIQAELVIQQFYVVILQGYCVMQKTGKLKGV